MVPRTPQGSKATYGPAEKHKACHRNSPVDMYQRDLPIGERIPGPAVSETAQRNANINSVNVETAEQESEYDSASDEEDARGDAEPLREVEINDVDINFLSKTIRTHSGRAITLSNRALSSYS